MAVLTATGITFSDTTQLNSRTGIFPTSTAWVYYQANAPTGWTRSTTHNDKALRVVSGSGGGSGGSNSFTTTMSSFNVAGQLTSTVATGGTQLVEAQIPSHSHPSNSLTLNAVPALFNPAGQFTGWNGGDVARNPGWTRVSPGVNNIGSNGSHSHPVSVSGPVSQPVSIAVQYIDVIVCTFNG
jgi:hypothetical protein